MRWIRILASLSTLLSVLALFGCSKELEPPIGTPSDGPPQRGGTLTFATFVRFRSIDPAVTFDEGSLPVVRLIFAPLFRVSRTGKIQGDLVERFRLSEDGLQLTMHLRRDARFHDGTPVLAQDVKRSLERTLHPDTPCPAPSFFDHITGFAAFRTGKAKELSGVQVISKRGLRIVLSKPDTTLLPVLTLSFSAPVCRAAGSTYDPNFTLEACGAGPFRLQAWEGQEAIELRRHDDYHGASHVYLDGIRWLFGVRSTAQRFRFERGQLDLVHELSAADAIAFRSDPRWRPLGHWVRPRSTRGIFMNTTMEPFDQLEVRQAVSHAIDRKQIASLRDGHLVPANSVIPSGVLGHDKSFPGQHHDMNKALALMRHAGWAYDPQTGEGGYPKAIDYYCPADTFDSAVAEVYQQQLARIGIQIRIKAMTWPAYLALTGRRGQAAMGSEGWTADFDHPSDFFEPLFSTSAIQDEDSQNRAFYSNPELDALLNRARQEMNPELSQQMYRRADTIIRDEAPWAIVYGFRYYEVHQGYLQGYKPHPHAYLDVSSVWIDSSYRRRMQASRGAPPGSLNVLSLALTGGHR